MPDLHAVGPADTPGGPPPRPVTFARRLRANLPSPADLIIYAAIAAVLWQLCHFTVPVALTVTAVAAAARLIALTVIDYAETGDDTERGDG
jgi:hypothetical protein